MPARAGKVSSPVTSKSIPLVLPQLHPGQQKIADEAKRFNVACMGRRWGKSFFCRDRLIHPMLKGFPTAWFAPTNKILADSWREMKIALQPITKEKSEDEHRIDIIGGGSVEMWSLESPDAGRSRRYKTVVVDEAAMCSKLEEFWNANIRPTLTDFAGNAWIVSTPKGMNYFKTMFDRGMDPSRPDWISWQLPTYTNPWLPPGEVEEARRDCTEGYFNQEYLALFVNWEGSVFRNVEECCIGKEEEKPLENDEYVIGVDWGRSRDYTVFTVISTKRKKVVAMDRSNKVDYSLQRGRLATLRDKWKPIEIIAEVNSIGLPIIEQLRQDGVRVRAFETTHASKNRIIEHLALAFERKQITALDNPLVKGELSAFQGEQLPSGIIRYSAASGHDDIVMSLAIGWSLVASPLNLGLIDVLREDQMKVEAAKMNKLAKADNMPGCVECGSKSVVKVGAGFRCNQCGTNFGDKQVSPAAMYNRSTFKSGRSMYGW